MNLNHPMPTFVIDVCSSDDNIELPKTQLITSMKTNSLSRSVSLPNYDEIYKDLSGIIHYLSTSDHVKNSFGRSHTYPKNKCEENNFTCLSPTLSTKMKFNRVLYSQICV